MQKIKILIFIVLLFVGFSFNGELYMLYLDNFQESYYQAGFSLDRPSKEVSDDEIIHDFINAGEKHDVDFFLVDRKIKSVNETNITIYGTDNALQHLQSQGIKEGKNKSLFFGEATIRYESFNETKNVTDYDNCYFIGEKLEKENLYSFKADLIDQYGGGFPKQKGSDKETWLNLLSVWGIIFSLSLMMTLYGVVYQKKETMVRIIFGKNLNTIFGKNILIDTASFIFLFLLIPRLIYNYSNVYFKMSFIIFLFATFLIINILLNATILHINFKKDIGGGNNGRGLLISSYALKVITAILTILVLASNVVIIRDAYNLHQQRDFFEEHKNYSYYQLNYKINNNQVKSYEDELYMNQKFYEKFQKNSLQYVDLTENLDSSYPVLLSNKTAMDEIKKRWPSIASKVEKATKEQIYLFLPASISINSREHNIAMEISNAFFDETEYGNVETFVYDKDIFLSGIHRFNNYRMKLYKNPILLYNNKPFKTNKLLTGYNLYYGYDTMYDISNRDWDLFIKDFELEDQITFKSNVLDVYESSWSLASRNMKLTMILSAFLLFLEMTLIFFIIRLEYQFNAIEMALKKIHGYSLFNRNKHILTVTIISSLVGILIALILSNELRMQGGYPLILAGLLLLLLEIGYIFQKARTIEKRTVVSVLKGEKV